MKDKYRRTIDKVKFDDQAQKNLKTNLLNRTSTKNYKLKYVAIFATFVVIAFIITPRTNEQLPTTIYTVEMSNNYYDNEMYKRDEYVLSMENELLSINTDDWKIVKVISIDYEIENDIVYSIVNAINVQNDEKVKFRILGGVISKQDWIEITDGAELVGYKDETYIKILSKYPFEVEVDLIYVTDSVSTTIYQTRMINDTYEAFIDSLDKWVPIIINKEE